jgi:hypothetical protein
MEVNQKEFFHIHKIVQDDTWEIGTSIEFNKSRKNRFFLNLQKDETDLLHKNYRSDLSTFRSMLMLGSKNLELLEKLNIEQQRDHLKDTNIIMLNMLKASSSYLGYYIKYLREVIFENIRKESFTEKPSRQHGIWLCTQEEISKWVEILGDDCQVEVFKVTATGIIHHANASLLLADTLQIHEYEDLARRYWTEVAYEKEYCTESEILLEGQIILVEKISKF